MILFKMAGIDIDTGEITDEMAALLLDEAHLFLRAGGALSYSEWCSLEQMEKVCFAKAGDIIRLETMLKTAHAGLGVEEMAQVASDVDGGKMKEEITLANVLEASAEKRRNKVVSIR